MFRIYVRVLAIVSRVSFSVSGKSTSSSPVRFQLRRLTCLHPYLNRYSTDLEVNDFISTMISLSVMWIYNKSSNLHFSMSRVFIYYPDLNYCKFSVCLVLYSM